MNFKIQTTLLIIASIIGAIYCTPEADKCCQDEYNENDDDKTICAMKLNEGLKNGILPQDKQSEFVPKACTATIETKKKIEFSAPQFGFLVSLGKDEKFYEDFLKCYPPSNTNHIFFYISRTEALTRDSQYSLQKAIEAGGAAWWTNVNENDPEYLQVLLDDSTEAYKGIILEGDFQRFYNIFLKWVKNKEAHECNIKHLFDVYRYNRGILQHEEEKYKNDILVGIKIACPAYKAEQQRQASLDGSTASTTAPTTPSTPSSDDGSQPSSPDEP